MIVEAITLSEGFIVNETVDEAQILTEIQQKNPVAFSMYLEMAASSQSTSEVH